MNKVQFNQNSNFYIIYKVVHFWYKRSAENGQLKARLTPIIG